MRRMLALFFGLVLLLSPHEGAMAGADAPTGAAFTEAEQEAAFSQALAENRLALKAVQLEIALDEAQVLSEIDRYNAAIARYEENKFGAQLPKAADADGVIRLTLADIYKHSEYLSMSMDGMSLLTIAYGVPYIFHLDTGRLTILAPDESVSQEYYDAHYKRRLDKGTVGRNTNDGGLEWSPDGRYLLMSSSFDLLTLALAGTNTLLGDVTAGTLRPLDSKLSADAKLLRGRTSGAPFRATFHPSEPVAYVEYVLPAPDRRVNQIWAFNLSTDEAKVVNEYALDLMTSDPSLWYTRLGLAQSIQSPSIRSGVKGVAFRGVDGENIEFITQYEAQEGDGYTLKLISMAGERGIVLHQNLEFFMIFPRAPLQFFSLDNLDPAMLDTALVVDPQQSPDKRLGVMPYTKERMAAQGIDPEELLEGEDRLFPVNATLSPDGNYALLMTTRANSRFTQAVYLYDMERDLLSQVALPDTAAPDEEYELFGFHQARGDMPSRGMRWLQNNRLLIVQDGKYKLFELVVQ